MKTNFGNKLRKAGLTLTAILALTGATKAIEVDGQYQDSIRNTVLQDPGLTQTTQTEYLASAGVYISDDMSGVQMFENNGSEYLGPNKLLIVDRENSANELTQTQYENLVANAENNIQYALVDATNKSIEETISEINDLLGFTTIEESFPYSVTGQMNAGAYLVALNAETQDTLGTSNSPIFGLNFNQNNDTIQARFIVDGYPDSQNLDTIIELYSGQNNMLDLRTNPIFTGLDSYEQKETSVFPNPCTSSVTVDFDETDANGRIEMYDTRGRLVQADQERAGEDIKLNTQGLAPGTYILNISSDNNQGGVTYKVIKQ